AFVGYMEGVLVNGQAISDYTFFWEGNVLHIESSTQNPIKSVQLTGIPCSCTGIQFDNLSYNQIPEFPTVAFPVAAILGLIFVFQRRKD
ncbi:MAG: hypothetical protein QG610_1409, partial [Euryarchaeota archaeon]|nr:hypothetical protein [Euryarchaeota archaeon]